MSVATNLKEHVVQFYQGTDGLLTANVGRYLGEGLRRGDGVLVVAGAEHKDAFERELERIGSGPDAAIRDGRLVFLDADEMLARFMVDGQPEWDWFEKALAPAMWEVRAHASNMQLRAYGEMVGILWKNGNVPAAIRIEEFWTRLLKSSFFKLFCAYPIDIFSEEFQVSSVDAVLCAHT